MPVRRLTDLLGSTDILVIFAFLHVHNAPAAPPTRQTVCVMCAGGTRRLGGVGLTLLWVRLVSITIYELQWSSFISRII